MRLLFQPHRLEMLIEPLRLLVSVSVFRGLLEFISTSALLRDYLLKLLILLFTLGVAALVMRIVDLISDQSCRGMNSRERALSYSVLPLGIRFIKICIFCIAILFVLAAWGYNTNTILAGLGVGGLAVALAAQKTIENLFGSISVITDRPVLVGDLCQFGGQMGTVEDIGLRSTRHSNERSNRCHGSEFELLHHDARKLLAPGSPVVSSHAATAARNHQQPGARDDGRAGQNTA